MSPGKSSRPAKVDSGRRFWITLSELVGVLALVIAGLNYWDSHRDRAGVERREAVQAKAAATQESLVLTGEASGGGAQVALQPLRADQAVQEQSFTFPTALTSGPKRIVAARPAVQRDWLAEGLAKALIAGRRANHLPSSGDGVAPMGLDTSFMEDGTLRSDRAIYRLGYTYRFPLFGGPRIVLLGVSVARRGVQGDLQAAVDRMWATERPDRD